MSSNLSIVTPHKNDFIGLKSIFLNLQSQTSTLWEWIVVDDNSDDDVKKELYNFFNETKSNVKIVYNQVSSNASKCRNLGFEHTQFSNIIFLDSDDSISNDFVENRLIDVIDFTVFLNFNVVNDKQNILYKSVRKDFLDNYLKAKFAWQTTSILWNKVFFEEIGKFDQNLKLLQDVEISIRALSLSKRYQVLLDNKVDFYYFVKPIDIKKRSIEKVCLSVDYLINTIYEKYNLPLNKIGFLSNYYYLSTRYLVRANESENFKYVCANLKRVYKIKSVTLFEYCLGFNLLKAYKYKFISSNLFLKINRKIFKKR